MQQADIPSIAAVILLDGDGKRIVVRYYKSALVSSVEEMAFEKKLFDKTARTNAKSEAEIIILDGLVTVYRNNSDVCSPCPALASVFANPHTIVNIARQVWLYVVGTQTENELILVNVLSALYDALGSLLRGMRLSHSAEDTPRVTQRAFVRRSAREAALARQLRHFAARH